MSSSSCAANFTSCPLAGLTLPADFCCSDGSSCLTLAGNTTIVCCPSSSSCRLIEPITCNVSLQNATLHPDASVKTMALDGSLSTCGTECCPFGYSCNSANQCVMDEDQDVAPLAEASGSSSASTSGISSESSATASGTSASATTQSVVESITSTSRLSSSTGTGSSTLTLATTSPASTSSAESATQKTHLPAWPFVVGSVLVVLAAVSIWFWAARRARARKSHPQQDSDTFTVMSPRDGFKELDAVQNTRYELDVVSNPNPVELLGSLGEPREDPHVITIT